MLFVVRIYFKLSSLVRYYYYKLKFVIQLFLTDLWDILDKYQITNIPYMALCEYDSGEKIPISSLNPKCSNTIYMKKQMMYYCASSPN